MACDGNPTCITGMGDEDDLEEEHEHMVGLAKDRRGDPQGYGTDALQSGGSDPDPPPTCCRKVFQCLPVIIVLGISAAAAVTAAISRDGIKDLLDSMDPDKNAGRGVLWFFSGIFAIWGAMFLPSSFYVLATGYFFQFRGFGIFFPWLLFGIAFEFALGRWMGQRYFGIEQFRLWFPSETKYMISLQSAFRHNGVWLSFLVVCLPIPLAINLMIVGLFTDVEWYRYAAGALASTLLSLVPLLCIGANAGDLGAALDPSEGGALRFSLTVVGLVLLASVLLMVPLAMRRELNRLAAKEALPSQSREATPYDEPALPQPLEVAMLPDDERDAEAGSK